jgi:hypothetical protein
MRTGVRALTIDNRELAILWRDAEDGQLSVEIEPDWDGMSDAKEIRRLAKFLEQCAKRMESAHKIVRRSRKATP